jgi:RecB family exonuclease
LARNGLGTEVLDELDQYQSEHFSYRLDGQWLDSTARSAALRTAWRHVDRLLRELAQPPRRLTRWSHAIFRLLVEVYGHRAFDRNSAVDRIVLAACDAVRQLLEGMVRVPEAVAPTVPAATAIRWLLDDVRQAAIPAPSDPDAIEMLGWLELPLDDAPAAVVTSFNEGFVPASVNSDLFLPNALRQWLGIMDNERRYARDAYAVSVLVRTRAELRLVVARRNREGDPLAPSRLLFADDPDSAARRALEFFSVSALAREELPFSARLPGVEAADRAAPPGPTVPRPRPLDEPINRLSVTSFRDYLACPYRFYLRHVLRLEAVDDTAQEMDGRAFGNLAHGVLSDFGSSDRRNTTDVDELVGLLSAALDRAVARQFGTAAFPAVMVQVEQLRLRLKAFAAVQAEWAAQGWTIESSELAITGDQPATLVVDDEPFHLLGRIDRVDFHPGTGERVIWDYKTSDAGTSPQETHVKSSQWIDLQLPLYRHLARSQGITGRVRLGYILLPKDVSGTGLVIADWSEGMLAEADESAREVIRRIRRQEFWPPAHVAPRFSDDYAVILQERVLLS